MFESNCVGNEFKILVTDCRCWRPILYIEKITNITEMSSTWWFCHQHVESVAMLKSLTQRCHQHHCHLMAELAITFHDNQWDVCFFTADRNGYFVYNIKKLEWIPLNSTFIHRFYRVFLTPITWNDVRLWCYLKTDCIIEFHLVDSPHLAPEIQILLV